VGATVGCSRKGTLKRFTRLIYADIITMSCIRKPSKVHYSHLMVLETQTVGFDVGIIGAEVGS